MSDTDLTLQDRDVLNAVRDYGGSPHTRDVAHNCRFGVRTCLRVLSDLEDRGYVTNASPRHGTGYVWETTALAVSELE